MGMFIPKSIGPNSARPTGRKRCSTGIWATAGSRTSRLRRDLALRALRPARGLAVGDLDGDGRPEIVIVNMNEPPYCVEEPGAARLIAVAITLTGTSSNRSAVGARCTVEANGRKQIAEVMSGGSFYSQNSMTLYFGLGSATKIDRLEVRWPAGSTQKWAGVEANRTLRITEGNARIESIPWTTAHTSR